MPLLHHVSADLFWTLTAAFVAIPAAGLLWMVVQLERRHHRAGDVRGASWALQGSSCTLSVLSRSDTENGR
jgi:hypothetical protein